MKRETPQSKFVLCVRNDGSEDLEPRKVYPVLSDRSAAREGYVRVVDESGEDYLYPAAYFVAVHLPASITRQLSVRPKRAVQRTSVIGRRSRSMRLP